MASDNQPPIEESTAIPHWNNPDADQPTIINGEGVTVYDDSGNSYLDFLSQLYCCNAGHSNEAITDAISSQLEQIQYVSSSKHNDVRSALAADIVDIAPGDLSDVFFSVSGSEANEAAIQLARSVTDGGKVLTRWQSYHGGTYASGGLTGDPSTRATLERHAATTGSAKFLPPLPKAFDGAEGETLTKRAADHLEFVIRNEGVDDVTAVLMEPIGGTSGAYTAPPGYFERVREICDEYDVYLISDEVITGFGRCGDWFGIGTEDVVPDMITFAKGVTSAYIPLAGVIVSESISETIRNQAHDVGQTFAGHPVACAAGQAAIAEYKHGLLDHSRDMTPLLEDALRDLASSHDVIEEIRGRGLHWSVVFADPETGEPFVHPWIESDDDNPVATVRSVAQEHGALFGSGRPDTQIIVCPPLCVTPEEIDEAIGILDTAIEAVFG